MAFLLSLLPTVIEFGGKFKWWLIGGAAALAGLWFVYGSINSYIDDERLAARTAAIAECNTVQLEEELRSAQALLESANKRNQDLVNELATRNVELQDLEEFIANAQGELDQFETGEISEQTRVFMRILSERSGEYYAQENPDN